MAKIKKLSFKLATEKTATATVVSQGDSLVKGLTDHPETFEKPEPPIADISEGLALLKAANSVPEDYQNNTTRDLLQKRKKDFINNLYMPSSYYVLGVAKEDRYIAGLVGIPMNTENTTTHDPSAITAIFDGVGAAAGTANVRISDRAGNALFKVFLKVGDNWVLWDAYNTLSFIVAGLPSGSSTIRIIGKKGEVESPEFDLVVRAS